MRNVFCITVTWYGTAFKGGAKVDKIVIVVEKGMVQSVYGSQPYQTEIEILDLDCTDPDFEQYLQDRKQAVEQYLCKIY